MNRETSGPKGSARLKKQRHQAAASSLCKMDCGSSILEANVWQHREHPAVREAIRRMVPTMVDGQLRCNNCRAILLKSYIQIHICSKKLAVALLADDRDGLVNSVGPFPRCTLCNVIVGGQQPHSCTALSRMGVDLSAMVGLFGDGDAAGGWWDEEVLSPVRNNAGHWVTVFPDLWAPPGHARVLCHHLFIWKR